MSLSTALTSVGMGCVLSLPPFTFSRTVHRPWLHLICDSRSEHASVTRRLVRSMSSSRA